jgi:uncharacterized protein Veg
MVYMGIPRIAIVDIVQSVEMITTRRGRNIPLKLRKVRKRTTTRRRIIKGSILCMSWGI